MKKMVFWVFNCFINYYSLTSKAQRNYVNVECTRTVEICVCLITKYFEKFWFLGQWVIIRRACR